MNRRDGNTVTQSWLTRDDGILECLLAPVDLGHDLRLPQADVTPRHSADRLGIAAFALRAGVRTKTLETYIRRRMETNPVPGPCGKEPISGQRWWCTKHVDLWIGRRPRAHNRKDPK